MSSTGRRYELLTDAPLANSICGEYSVSGLEKVLKPCSFGSIKLRSGAATPIANQPLH
jgi:hypothetical protein